MKIDVKTNRVVKNGRAVNRSGRGSRGHDELLARRGLWAPGGRGRCAGSNRKD